MARQPRPKLIALIALIALIGSKSMMKVEVDAKMNSSRRPSQNLHQ